VTVCQLAVTPPSRVSARARSIGRSAVGFAAWLVAVVALPAPLAARIFLLAPLVIVPRLLTVIPRPAVGAIGGWPALGAALVLTGAFAVPAGPLAAALALPWAAVVLVAAAAGLADGVRNLPGLLHPRRAADLGVDAALGFLAVGAAFALIDRLAVPFMGFSPAIVLLTATHFHFAGFGLLCLVSLHSARRTWLRAAVLGLIVGVPLTALGFIVPSNELGAAGAIGVGVSGIGFGVALVTDTRATSAVTRLAGAALLVSMPMAIAWSVAILIGATFLDLDAMVRTHGALNAAAVLLASLSYRDPNG
jgi:YndJ-like protein